MGRLLGLTPFKTPSPPSDGGDGQKAEEGQAETNGPVSVHSCTSQSGPAGNRPRALVNQILWGG